jgi:3-keto-5-aminohexanoate cleavage enzyme
METYHSGGAWVMRDLIERKLVEPPYLIQTVMGAQTASYPTPDHVLQLLRELPDQSVWLCSGIGPFQLPLTTLSLLMGGHARVGLEDNLYYSRGRKFVDNAEAVRRVVRIAGELNRKVATPAETRTLLGLPAKSKAIPSNRKSA